MLHVFVDTNVLLRVFNKTSDTINEVEVLLELVKAHEVKLYSTDQVCDEYYRNVESEISEAIKAIELIPDKVELPRITQEFDNSAEILQAFNVIRSHKKELLELAKAAAAAGELRADALVNELFENSETIARTDDLIAKARLRRDLGNPPGKKDSLGDQLNWECLLSAVGDHDIHIISKDGDFAFKADSTSIKQYLTAEWEAQKGSSAHLYTDLKSFLVKNFPKAKTPIDAKKETALKNLEKSGSYIKTHKQIAILGEIFEKLEKSDAIRALEAFVDNNQINWLAFDEDVKDFYTKLFDRFYPETPADLDKKLVEAAPYFEVEAPF